MTRSLNVFFFRFNLIVDYTSKRYKNFYLFVNFDWTFVRGYPSSIRKGYLILHSRYQRFVFSFWDEKSKLKWNSIDNRYMRFPALSEVGNRRSVVGKRKNGSLKLSWYFYGFMYISLLHLVWKRLRINYFKLTLPVTVLMITSCSRPPISKVPLYTRPKVPSCARLRQ